MGSEEADRRRVLARCTECDSVYTAWAWGDDDVRIVGRGSCPCGADDFTVIEP